MINSSQQKDRRVESNRQAERASEASEARKRTREEELRQLHVLATEVAALMGGVARAAAAGNAWMLIDVGENHELSFYREGDNINIRGRIDRVAYALNVSPRLTPDGIVKAIRRSTP